MLRSKSGENKNFSKNSKLNAEQVSEVSRSLCFTFLQSIIVSFTQIEKEWPGLPINNQPLSLKTKSRRFRIATNASKHILREALLYK